MLPPEKVALVPSGKPFALSVPSFEIPVAAKVEWVISVNNVLIHNVGLLDAAPAEQEGATTVI